MMTTKIFKVDGLEYYVVNTFDKKQASVICIKNRFGLLPENLVEVTEVPKNAEKVIVAVWNEIVTGTDFNEQFYWSGCDFCKKHEYMDY